MKKRIYDFAVIGGDLRQAVLAQILTAKGCRVCHYALCRPIDDPGCHPVSSLKEAVLCSENIIAPIPMTKNNMELNHQVQTGDLCLSSLISLFSEEQYFFAGCIPDKFREAAHLRNVRVFDFMDSEELSVFNSIATAEGAVAEAITKSGRNLHGSSCLILGYGRCAKTLTACLRGMFCHTTVCARKPQAMAEAAILADKAVSISDFETHLNEYDFIFNTIPAPVLLKEHLVKMKKHVTIIDIASAPGGVDFAAAARLNLSAYLCPGLPGKYAPVSSAQAIADTIFNYLGQP